MNTEIREEVINGKIFFICKHNFKREMRSSIICKNCDKENTDKLKQNEIEKQENIDKKGIESTNFYYTDDGEEICKTCVDTLTVDYQRCIKYCPHCFKFKKVIKTW